MLREHKEQERISNWVFRAATISGKLQGRLQCSAFSVADEEVSA